MIVTRGKLTVDQAAREALLAECVECGESTIFLGSREQAAVEHRCAHGAAGPVWTLIERPNVPARRRSNRGGVITREQAAAATRLLEALDPPAGDLTAADFEPGGRAA